MAEYYDQNADGGTQRPWITVGEGSAQSSPAELRAIMARYPGYQVRLPDGSAAIMGENGGITIATPADGGVMTRNITGDGYDRTDFNSHVNILQGNIRGVASIAGAALLGGIASSYAGAGGGLAANTAVDAAAGTGALYGGGTAAGTTAAGTVGATMGADGVIYPTAAEAAAASGTGTAATAANAARTGATTANTSAGIGDALQRVMNGTATAADWVKIGLPLAGAAGALADRGDRTVTTQTLMDPTAKAYLEDYKARAQRIADQPYQAPGFSMTVATPWQQTQASQTMASLMNSPTFGQVGDLSQQFMSGARDGSAAANPYMGQVSGLIGQGTAQGTAAANQYMPQVNDLVGKGTSWSQAAVNPLFGLDNPELTRQVDYTLGDLNRNYANMVAPKFSSGSSFGNSGLAQQEVEARNDLARNMARAASDMRYQNYALQANLGESAAQRADTLLNADKQRQMAGASLYGNLGESAAGRADNMFNSNASRALQGASLYGNLGESQASRMDNMFNSNANRALTAGQMALNNVTTQGNLANSLYNQGTQQYTQGQQNLLNNYTEFLRGQNWSRDQLAAMAPGVGVGLNTGMSQTTPGPSSWASILAGLAGGTGLARYV